MSLSVVTQEPAQEPDEAEIAWRGVKAGFGRYTTAGEDRAAAAKKMLESAVFLHVAHADPIETGRIVLRALKAACFVWRRGNAGD